MKNGVLRPHGERHQHGRLRDGERKASRRAEKRRFAGEDRGTAQGLRRRRNEPAADDPGDEHDHKRARRNRFAPGLQAGFDGELGRVPAHERNEQMFEREKADGVDESGQRRQRRGKRQMPKIVRAHGVSPDNRPDFLDSDGAPG